MIGANPDGTIVAPKTFEPGEAHFREVAPDVWHEIGGTRQLALRTVNGVKTVLDSEDPTSVLQAVPAPQVSPVESDSVGGLIPRTGTGPHPLA